MVMAAVIPHGPKGHFLIGNVLDLSGNQLEFVTGCARDYGDIVRLKALKRPFCFLNHPDYIEYILVTNHHNFIKAVTLRSPFMQRFLGNGLLTSEKKFWL